MKLSISNIAWDQSYDTFVFKQMRRFGFTGLEIAPTKYFSENPYQKLIEAQNLRNKLDSRNLKISSIQSIWYGRTEKIFEDELQRKFLLDYTKSALKFASVLKCKNLVFGCPRNRNITEHSKENFNQIAFEFFYELGEYAKMNQTVIGVEANPIIYNTNYLNTTSEALMLIKDLNSEGIRLNLDVGTMIYNQESLSVLENKISMVNHVHISEPWLKVIEYRDFHKDLNSLLNKENYQGFVSIEMENQKNMDAIVDSMKYISEIFND